jgi:GPH family glycoside/pentoside/hexuronide:cation symporter
MEQFKGARRLLYNASTAGWSLLDAIFLTFYVAFLLPPKEKIAEGMVPFISNEVFLGVFTVLGLVMIFGRIVDAVADPLVAYWSDRSRSPLGRRRSFILIGIVPLAICPVLIFYPPLASTSWINGLYLALVFGVYFFAFTLYVGPYLALIPELGRNQKERLGMTTFQGYFSLIGNGIAMIGGPLLITLYMGTRGPVGAYRLMALTLAVPGLIIASLVLFAVDEKRFSNAVPSTVPLKESFLQTIKNRAFVIYLVGNLGLWFLFNIIRASAIPVAITLVKADEAFASTMFTLFFAAAAVCFPFVNLMARRIGLKLAMILGLGSFAVLSILFGLTGLAPVSPRVWVMVVAALMGFPIAVLLVVPNVMVAQLSEADAKRTGQRREAMFFGVQGFFMKLNLGVSTAILALMYSLFGKDIADPLGVRLALVVGSVAALVGLLVMTRYPGKPRD